MCEWKKKNHVGIDSSLRYHNYAVYLSKAVIQGDRYKGLEVCNIPPQTILLSSC